MESNITIFGDSITYGAWDPSGGGWAGRLRRHFELLEDDYTQVYNLGVCGDTAGDLLARFSAECLARNKSPQTIIFAIGINDSQLIGSKDNLRTPMDEFQSNLEKLIKNAKKYSKKIIFIGLTSVDESKTMPVPWSTEKFYSNSSIGIYDAAIKDICEKNSLPFISMSDLLSPNDLDDVLHPNSEGHEKMFSRILSLLNPE
jgi:lysophospholipase L1-like esterase